MLINKDEN